MGGKVLLPVHRKKEGGDEICHLEEVVQEAKSSPVKKREGRRES